MSASSDTHIHYISGFLINFCNKFVTFFILTIFIPKVKHIIPSDQVDYKIFHMYNSLRCLTIELNVC